MNNLVSELERYATDLRDSIPENESVSRGWMNDLVDFCNQCIYGGGIRPELEASIALRDRGLFLRAVRNLHSIGQLFNTGRRGESQESMAVVRRVLAEVGKQTLSSEGWTEEDFEKQDVLLPISSRKAFEEDIAQAVAEASPIQPLALVMIDIDNCKSVNDKHGHPVGDEVLKAVANAVKKICSKKGKAYRYGGEELSALLCNCAASEASATAERMRATVNNLNFSVAELRITASFGVATCESAEATSVELVKTADAALYASKGGGRNRVTVTRAQGEQYGLATINDKLLLGNAAGAALKLAFEGKRKQFLHSEAGVNAFREEYKNFSGSFKTAIEVLMKTAPSVKVQLFDDRGRYLLVCEGFSVTVHLSLAYGNTLENSEVRIVLWNGVVARATQMQWEEPKRVGEWKLKYDMVAPETTGWKGANIAGGALQSSMAIAEFVLTTLLNRVAQEKAL